MNYWLTFLLRKDSHPKLLQQRLLLAGDLQELKIKIKMESRTVKNYEDELL